MKIYELKDKIIDKLVNDDNYGFSYKQAENIYNSDFKDIPDEIIKNIEEWLNDEPFSEIDYYGLSIKKLQDKDKSLNNINFRTEEYIKIINYYNTKHHPSNRVYDFYDILDIGYL